MFEEIFKRKRPVFENLVSYGFRREGNSYQFITDIQDGEFVLTIQIDTDGIVTTDLREKDTGEIYALYKTNAIGAYVGKIRADIEQILCDIVQHCYVTEIFKTEQAQMAIEFVRKKYGDELEFLWTKFPDNAVWRRKDNKKWYGAILTVQGNKIGLDINEIVEIIDLRMPPDQASQILNRTHYYPGWHMNKKSWYTLVLNGSVSDDEIRMRIQESYQLAVK